MTTSRSSQYSSQLPDWVHEKRRELASDNVNRAYSAALEILKWVLTSALVLHSSALIAAMGSTKFAEILSAGPIWFFVAGIGLTISGGLALAISAAVYAGEMSAALWCGEGLDSATNDVFDPNPNRATLIGAVLLGLSVGSFIVGAGYSVVAMRNHVTPVASVQGKAK